MASEMKGVKSTHPAHQPAARRKAEITRRKNKLAKEKNQVRVQTLEELPVVNLNRVVSLSNGTEEEVIEFAKFICAAWKIYKGGSE